MNKHRKLSFHVNLLTEYQMVSYHFNMKNMSIVCVRSFLKTHFHPKKLAIHHLVPNRTSFNFQTQTYMKTFTPLLPVKPRLQVKVRSICQASRGQRVPQARNIALYERLSPQERALPEGDRGIQGAGHCDRGISLPAEVNS